MTGRNLLSNQSSGRNLLQAPVQQSDSGLTVDQLNRLEEIQAQVALEQEQLMNPQVNPFQSTLIGMGKGFTDAGRGIGNLFMPGQPFQPQQGEVEAFETLKETNPITSRVGEFTGEVAGTAPLGGLAGGIVGRLTTGLAAKLGAGKTAQTIAGSTAFGAGEGAAVAAQLDEDIGTGAAIGAGAGAVLPLVFKAGSNVFQNLTGKSLPKGVFDEAGNLTEEAQKELVNAGIPLETFAGEVENLVKQNFTPSLDLPAQVRSGQLQEFAPDAQARPSRLSRDFGAQNAEETLINMNTPEGAQMVVAQQQLNQQLQEGAERNLLSDLDTDLISQFNTVTSDANKGILGESTKEAINEIRNISETKVTALYNSAKDLIGEGAPVDTTSLRLSFDDAIADTVSSPATESKVAGVLKEFGIIQEGDELFDAAKVPATRQIQPLTLDNAEKLRQRLNKLDPRDGSPDSTLISIVRQNLDSTIDGMIDSVPEGSAAAQAFKTARQASADYKRTFGDKELISRLVNFKKGTTDIDQIPSEKVLDTLLRSDLKSVQKLKQIMIENPTTNSKKAWNEMRFTVIDDLLRQSMNRNTAEISGQRLNTALAKIGDERLKLLLGNEKFNQLKRFQKVVSDQTIPIAALEGSQTSSRLTPMLMALGNLVKGSANVATGGIVNIADNVATNRSAIEQAIKESQGSIGRSQRAKAFKARKQVADFFKELGNDLSISAAVVAGNE